MEVLSGLKMLWQSLSGGLRCPYARTGEADNALRVMIAYILESIIGYLVVNLGPENGAYVILESDRQTWLGGKDVWGSLSISHS